MHTKYLFWTLALALIIFLFGAKVLLQLHDGLSIVSTRSGHKYTWDPPENTRTHVVMNDTTDKKTDTKQGIAIEDHIDISSYLSSARTPFLGKATVACPNCSLYANMTRLLPEKAPTAQQVFGGNRSCAVVTESHCLFKHTYGKLIDSHDVVLRLNFHIYKQHVAHGRKKTHILINNALWNKGEKVYRKFKRIRNRPEVIIFNNFRNSWTQYLESEFEQSKIADFLEIRKRKLKDSFVLDPVFTNQAYKNFETLSQTKLRHPCSTGFIGMFLMSRSCRSVSAFGFCNSKTDGNYRTMWHDYKNEHKVYEMWSRDVHFNLTLYPPPL